MKLPNPATYSPLLLRIGVGVVLLTFGADKLIHPQPWTNWIPPRLLFFLPISDTIFIYLLGAFEALLGFLLIIGLLTRTAALLTAANLAGVILSIGLNEISTRDFGLLTAAFALAILGPGRLSIDAKLHSKKDKKQPAEIILE